MASNGPEPRESKSFPEQEPRGGPPETERPPPPRNLSAPPPTPEILERCLTELVRYYRHSGVGRRCRGIIHKMNTPLQVLSFQLDLLEQKARGELAYLSQCSPDAARHLKPLLDYRLNKFRQFRQRLEELQNFTRHLTVQGVHEENQEQLYLDLNWIYGLELELYLSHPGFNRVERDLRLQKSLPPLYGHYIDFSQSFRNLVDNALEAMEGAEVQKLTVETAVQDRTVMLRIGDTGEGIPPENLPKIFQPFFTTRGKDRAGLGLFMVRRLLAPYKARLQVDSRPGGTWVTVHLPVSS